MTEVSAENAPVQAFTPTYSFAGNSSAPVMLGLYPNITGTLNPTASMINYVEQSGALSWGARGGRNDESGGSTAACYYPINFDASKSIFVYGKSATVQAAAIQILMIIKI